MIALTGNDLTLKDIQAIIFKGEGAVVSDEGWNRVTSGREAVEKILKEGKTVYGINTGFGKLSDVIIDGDRLDELQMNLIRSHACGVGEPFPEAIAKTMCLLRANTLLKGYSGVRPVVIERLLDMVNRNVVPVIPEQGSLGASGDLAPLAHLVLALTGEGEVFYQGRRMNAPEAFREEGLEPIELKAKEGLALINGTQAMTAVGAIAWLEAERLLRQSILIASLSFQALNGITDALDDRIHRARGFTEQMEIAAQLRRLLRGSRLTTRQGEIRVQDAYTLRCIPQIVGASLRALNFVKETLEIEINAATDNPLIFPEDGDVLSGGNFHGQPVALAMDFLKIAVSEIANVAERRVERLVNPQLNDLPPFLSPNPGLESGLMIGQYVAAALVSENKTLAHPASVDSIPSSGNQEDHVSMGTIAARHAKQIIDNTRNVLAIECICALQAIDYKDPEQLSPPTRAFYEQARKQVPKIVKDRIFSHDIQNMARWLKTLDVDPFFGGD
jgi:histidine ammonia-lyase